MGDNSLFNPKRERGVRRREGGGRGEGGGERERERESHVVIKQPSILELLKSLTICIILQGVITAVATLPSLILGFID